MTKFTKKQFKTILNKHKFIDNWFWTRYGLNPYNGCQFGCVYCDSRSNKYYLPSDFENDIIVKTNVGEMLDKRLSKARTLLPDIVGTGGTTDCYQPAEKEFKNTRQCLEVLAKHKYPVLVGTKSTLVLRDLDILDQIGQNTWSCVSLTITTTNAKTARFLETRAPSPQERFKVISTIKQKAKNIQVGVWLIPVVPFLTDSDEDLETMIRTSKESGADYIILGGGMTLRDSQALWFLQHLKNKFPELITKYETLYGFKYDPNNYTGSYGPTGNYSKKINQRCFELCKKYHLPYRIKRFIPDDYRKMNYLLAEQLLNKAYELQALGKAHSQIFWAGQNIQNLKESIVEIAKRGELKKIRNVDEKIESYILDHLTPQV